MLQKHNLFPKMAEMEIFKLPECYKKIIVGIILLQFEIEESINWMGYKNLLITFISQKIDWNKNHIKSRNSFFFESWNNNRQN